MYLSQDYTGLNAQDDVTFSLYASSIAAQTISLSIVELNNGVMVGSQSQSFTTSNTWDRVHVGYKLLSSNSVVQVRVSVTTIGAVSIDAAQGK
jgi:hypothetical protein